MYGEDRNWRYIIGFGVLIVLLFVAIFLIINHGSGSKGKVEETKKTLTSYATDDDFTVTETIVGPISASNTHDQVQVTVSNRMAAIDVSKGYDSNVVNSKTYDLSANGFGEFLSALDKAGFTKGSDDKELADDRGYCPTGQRYIFEAKTGSTTIERFWATSCGGTKTYKGNRALTTDLFQAQIPDFDALTQGSTFSSTLIGL